LVLEGIFGVFRVTGADEIRFGGCGFFLVFGHD